MKKQFKKFKFFKIKALIIGFGKTGVSISKALSKLECELSYWDDTRKKGKINGMV